MVNAIQRLVDKRIKERIGSLEEKIAALEVEVQELRNESGAESIDQLCQSLAESLVQALESAVHGSPQSQ